MESFRTDAKALVAHVKDIETKMSIAMDFQHANSEAANGATEFFRQRMREHIKDERLLIGMAGFMKVSCPGIANAVEVLLPHGVWVVDVSRLQIRICGPYKNQTCVSTLQLRRN